MDRRVWKARILPGKFEEYKKRHDEIWPEMVLALKNSGIENYTIWNNGNELIGYYECPDLEASNAYKEKSEVMLRWSRSMQGIMEMETEDGKIKEFKKVFELA